MTTEKVLGIKIRTFGFKGHFKKRSVIIMNHVSHFDWLFFWSVVDRYGDFSFWKVITKEKPLRQLPILGKEMCTHVSATVVYVHTCEGDHKQMHIHKFLSFCCHKYKLCQNTFLNRYGQTTVIYTVFLLS